MKISTEQFKAGHLRPAFSLGAAAALLACATLAQAAKVEPPPLPPGSHLVRVEPGMNKEEKKRQDRAHHHKGHFKKDIHADDSKGKQDDKGSKK